MTAKRFSGVLRAIRSAAVDTDTKPTPPWLQQRNFALKEESYTVDFNFGKSMEPLYKDIFNAIRNGALFAITPASVSPD